MTDSSPTDPSPTDPSPTDPAETDPTATGSGTSHPAIDPDAVARLRERAGAPAAAPAPGVIQPPVATASKLKTKARQAATPVVARVRIELDRAASGEVAALRAEVAQLRAELTRLRAEHDAAIAALREDRR